MDMQLISSDSVYLPGYGHRQGLSVCRQEQSTLNKLPADVIPLILKHLPQESVIAFALTCRTLFARHWPFPESARGMDRDTRAALLQLLEPGVPSLYFCWGCARLHPWRETLSSQGRAPCYCREAFGGFFRDGEFALFASGIVSVRRPDLTYAWARIVMNGHLLGPLHGPPIQDMQGHRTTKDSWCAKIIDDSLYVHFTTILRGSSSIGSAGLSGQQTRFLCRHLPPATLTTYISHAQSPAPHKGPHSNPSTEKGPIMGSCPDCFSDFRILDGWEDESTRPRSPWEDITGQRSPSEDKPRRCIQIDRWVNLGQCRSPYDTEWRTMTSQRPHAPRRHDISEAGMVYRTWMEANVGFKPVAEEAEFRGR